MKTLKTITIAVLLTFATLTTAQTKKPITKTATKPTTQTNYPSVQIGNQEWMTKNLEVSTFRNGDPIPQATTAQEWKVANKAKKPIWRYYLITDKDFQFSNNLNIQLYGKKKANEFFETVKGKKYGKFYNIHAVKDSRGITPKGWHIASYEDIKNFRSNNFKTGEYGETTNMADYKSNIGWLSESDNGTNSSGLNIYPSGNIKSDGTFDDQGDFVTWWVKYPTENGLGGFGGMNPLYSSYDKFRDTNEYKENGYSVRCVKDIVTTPVVQEKKGPTGQNYADSGATKSNSGDYKGAIEDYSNAINLSPNCDFCYRDRGYAKSVLKDYKGAITDYKKAIELSDGNLDFINPCQLYIGITYNVIGENEEGCSFLKDSQNNGNKEAQKYIDHFCGESEQKEQVKRPIQEAVNLKCDQISKDSKILSKPDPNLIESNDNGLRGLTFVAVSKITIEKGVFYSGYFVDFANSKVVDGIYYILSSEWKCQ
jgi:uncharacterized protein (TIGR02145 family)